MCGFEMLSCFREDKKREKQVWEKSVITECYKWQAGILILEIDATVLMLAQSSICGNTIFFFMCQEGGKEGEITQRE